MFSIIPSTRSPWILFSLEGGTLVWWAHVGKWSSATCLGLSSWVVTAGFAWFEGKTVSDFWISSSGSEKKSVFSLSLEFQFHKSGISWPATQTGNLCKNDICCQQKLSPTFLVVIVDFLRKRWLASNKQRHLLWAQKRQKCCLRRMGWELGMVGQKIGLYHTLYIHLCIHI